MHVDDREQRIGIFFLFVFCKDKLIDIYYNNFVQLKEI